MKIKNKDLFELWIIVERDLSMKTLREIVRKFPELRELALDLLHKKESQNKEFNRYLEEHNKQAQNK